jgi:hypothetical protein
MARKKLRQFPNLLGSTPRPTPPPPSAHLSRRALPLPTLSHPAAAAAPHTPVVLHPAATRHGPLSSFSRFCPHRPQPACLLLQLASRTNAEPLPVASATSSPYSWRAPSPVVDCGSFFSRRRHGSFFSRRRLGSTVKPPHTAMFYLARAQ